MNDSVQVLIVDDDRGMQHLLQKILETRGYAVALAGTGAEALERLTSEGADIVLSDIRMPGMDGMDLLRRILARHPGTTVIMMTAFGAVDSAVEAMKAGAYDYISKPFKMDEVLIVLARVAEEKRLRRELVSMREALAARYGYGGLIGKSRSMQELYDLIRRVAPTVATVLVTGESGTGKELVARAIHYNGPRRLAPFVPVNCAALPAELLESELFGHVRGAFTGATADRRGLFAEAHGGTLFLDEVSSTSAELQSRLLRVLQEREVRPVGGDRHLPVDVRVIAATNQRLESLVRSGAFREDLYYRLSVIPVRLPPLRERLEDLPLLVEHFLHQHSGDAGTPKRLSPEALAVFLRHSWPGNVRELENMVERLVVLCRGDEIGVEDLPLELGAREGGLLTRTAGRQASLAEVEREYIQLILTRTDGNQTQAAQILGIDRRTLARKLQEYRRSQGN